MSKLYILAATRHHILEGNQLCFTKTYLDGQTNRQSF